jgi:hypothetical protein
VIGAPDLLSLAQPLEVPSAVSSGAADRVVTGLLQRRVPKRGGPTRVRYPKWSEALRPVAEELRRRTENRAEFTMLAELLRDPYRAYRLSGEQRGAFVLLRSFLVEGSEPAVAVATLKLADDGREGEASLSTTLLRNVTEEELVSMLEELFWKVDPGERVGDAFREERKSILWIGESGRIKQPNWKHQLAAAGEARGLSIVLAPNPASFNSTHKKIEAFKGERIVVWTPTAAAFANRTSLPSPLRKDAVFLADSDFPRSLEEMCTQLDAPGEDAATESLSWEEVHDEVSDLQSEAFLMTRQCLGSLKRNPYPDPPRMLRFLTALAEAAEEWRDLKGDIGERFDRWAQTEFGIEIALHDFGLGDRAAFEYDGQQYSREPHVKVDDYKSPDKCGRIYFALDKERLRVIVDHVGLHL